MITLEQIAKYFEDGLNQTYNNPHIQFSIAPNAGIVRPPVREQNNITYYITGSMTVNSSSNDANLLVMGANGLSLEFAIPTRRPRTDPNQSPEELQKFREGQYLFVNEVVQAINTYFQKADSFNLSDGEDEYSLSFYAGTGMANGAQILPDLGECVIAYVSITLYFVKGGIISNKVIVTIDGQPVPFQAVRIGRSTVSDRDVYAGKQVSKAIASSSSFSIDFNFPLNVDNATEETLSFLLDGQPNTAHFVTVRYGKDAQTKIYLMSIDNTTENAEGVTVSGSSTALVEVVEHAEALNYPDGFQKIRFSMQSSEMNEITFNLSEECMYFLGGVTGEGSGEITIPLTKDDFVFNTEAGGYTVYLITDRAVFVTSSVPYEVI